MNLALGETASVVRFSSRGDMSSQIDGDGDVDVRQASLDALDIGMDIEPTFIKLDIEGAEPATLRGAKETLNRHRPILAVCVYHQPEHLFSIPLLINRLCPGYKFFLRRYAACCWEQICYAVPPERLVSR